MSTENVSTAAAEEIPNLLITPTAQEYLFDLLANLAYDFQSCTHQACGSFAAMHCRERLT